MAATPQQVREVIGKYVEAWTNGDRELLLSLFAEDATWYDPVGTPAFQGHAGIGRFWDFARKDPKRQIRPVPQQIIACANEGILRFVMQVRLPETNQGLDLQVVDRFVLNDEGRIVLAQAYWDETCASVPEGMELFAPNIEEAYQ